VPRRFDHRLADRRRPLGRDAQRRPDALERLEGPVQPRRFLTQAA
jgi:hypothetical protein